MNYVNDRIIEVILPLGGLSLHIISMYAPDTNRPEIKALDFYEQLQQQIDKITPDEKLILMGDVNGRIDNHIIDGVKQRFNQEVINERGKMLIEFGTTNELRINNTFYPHKQQHQYTWQDSRDRESTIDYII